MDLNKINDTKNRVGELRKPNYVSVEDELALQFSKSLANTESYSDYFRDLAILNANEYLLSNVEIVMCNEDVVDFMKAYEYEVSAWPFIISQNVVKKFTNLINPVVNLLYKSISMYFGNDRKSFAEYLNETEILLDLVSPQNINSRGMLIRHDVVFTNGKLRLLEINVGSTIGGWQHDWIKEIYQRLFHNNENTNDWKLSYRNILKNIFESLTTSIKSMNVRAIGNILMCAYPANGIDLNSLKKEFKSLYRKHRVAKSGELFFFSSFEEIIFQPNGTVVFQGQVMDAVLLTMPEDVKIPSAIYQRLTASYLSGNIIFPDNPIDTLLGNKMLLALLHEEVLRERLSRNEREFIDNYIPWTVKVFSRIVTWQGKDICLRELLRNNKEKFVLKKARSYQGKDVLVGHFMDEVEWNDCVDMSISETGWIAQEFCEPDSVIASSTNSQFSEYLPVWGIFHMDNLAV